MVPVLLGLLAVQLVVLVPLLLQWRNTVALNAVRAERARVEALLEALPPETAGRQAQVRPLIVGLEIRRPDGRLIARGGDVAFDHEQLRTHDRPFLWGSGVIDTAFDVERRDGTWNVLLRVHTRPALQQARPRLIGMGLLALLAVLITLAVTVLALRRKVMIPLQHQARHDSLTGLPNRAHFDERLHETIQRCRREGTPAALLFIDLDRFKDFNDNFGHPQGDALLVELAHRLRNAVATDCVAARLGGDEFAVILSYVEKAAEACTQAEQILETMSRPYRYNQFHFQLSASIGVAMLPEHGATPADAQRNADIAMYVAKRAGRARVTLFDSAMHEAVSRRKQVEDWLRAAIDRDELSVHYQPKLCMDGSRVEGAEALLRWRLGDGTSLLPGEFIPVAEESGLIVPLGRWVLMRVLRQIAEWKALGFEAPRISVNVSANQFLDEDFLTSFLGILDGSPDPQAPLDLEITESALITTPDHAVPVLKALRQRGITVSLDDFGTGYSSLSYLKRFPVNTIKIDHSFVVDMAEDRESAALVKAVIRMTHSLGLLFVAEGVETTDQLELLRRWGCDQYQGHVTAPALAPDEFLAFCRERAAVAASA